MGEWLNLFFGDTPLNPYRRTANPNTPTRLFQTKPRLAVVAPTGGVQSRIPKQSRLTRPTRGQPQTARTWSSPLHLHTLAHTAARRPRGQMAGTPARPHPGLRTPNLQRSWKRSGSTQTAYHGAIDCGWRRVPRVRHMYATCTRRDRTGIVKHTYLLESRLREHRSAASFRTARSCAQPASTSPNSTAFPLECTPAPSQASHYRISNRNACALNTRADASMLHSNQTGPTRTWLASAGFRSPLSRMTCTILHLPTLGLLRTAGADARTSQKCEAQAAAHGSVDATTRNCALYRLRTRRYHSNNKPAVLGLSVRQGRASRPGQGDG